MEGSKAIAPVRKELADLLTVTVWECEEELAQAAAEEAGEIVRRAIAEKGQAAVIFATGNSQILFLDKLARQSGIRWEAVTCFHMDEYLGLPREHVSCFRRYLRTRIENRLRPKVFHYIDSCPLEPLKECARYAGLLQEQRIDLCLLGVGDNGHLGFNDPPVADFEDPSPMKVVQLDDVSRRQQIRQGHFPDEASMPRYAFTLSVPTLCGPEHLMCLAPGAGKARIVSEMLEGPISEELPASVLRRFKKAQLMVDRAAAEEWQPAGAGTGPAS